MFDGALVYESAIKSDSDHNSPRKQSAPDEKEIIMQVENRPDEVSAIKANLRGKDSPSKSETSNLTALDKEKVTASDPDATRNCESDGAATIPVTLPKMQWSPSKKMHVTRDETLAR